MEIIAKIIADGIFGIAGSAADFWRNLGYANLSFWQIILDLIIVSVFFYYLFKLLKGSRSVSIMLGLLMIVLVYFISRTLNLITLVWLIDKFFMILLVAIPVIFQQELRMALEKIGNTPFGSAAKFVAVDSMINELVDAAFFMASKREGALIVLEGQIPLKEYSDNGTMLNADFSKELLLSIFISKGPMHDGAVIIKNQKIVAAKSVLPTSFESKDKNLGTRHKAAIGLTDHTDASVIVVSEEKGIVSFAKNGHLEKDINPETLSRYLKIVLQPEKKKRIFSLIKNEKN